MYDSVYPTRTARFGVALVPDGALKLKNAAFARDYRWVGLGGLGWARAGAGGCLEHAHRLSLHPAARW